MIKLSDGSKIKFDKYEIHLGPLSIISKRRSWYNRHGYFQSNYNIEKRAWNDLLNMSIGKFFDSYFKFFTERDLYNISNSEYFDSFISCLRELNYDFKDPLTTDNVKRILQEFIDSSIDYLRVENVDIKNVNINTIGKLIEIEIRNHICSCNLIIIYYLITFTIKYNCELVKYI